jgi:transcriptional regulator with XRE-family HTH domain
MFNPQRLSLARKRRRLSSKGFAELIGMSPVTITRLAKANNEPEPETVDLIAKKLGFPRKFFFGGDIAFTLCGCVGTLSPIHVSRKFTPRTLIQDLIIKFQKRY